MRAGRPAKERRRGNRYTGANMTAREAQTIVGCMDKMRKMLVKMDEREVYIGTRREIHDAYQSLINAILAGNRLEEIPTWWLTEN